MNLYLTCENLKQKISVPDDTDFTIMIDTFYESQVAWAKKHGRDSSKITKKTPQQIMNVLGKKEHDNCMEFFTNNVQPLSDLNEDNDDSFEEGFSANLMKDSSQKEQKEKENEVIALHEQLIANGMSEEQYQLILRCIGRHEEETIEDIADNMGIELSALTMRLQRAKKKFEKITGKPLVF